MGDRGTRVRGISIFRPIIYGNSAALIPENDRIPAANGQTHTHRWTVAVRSAASVPDSSTIGGADDLSYFLKRVTFKLHDTYANPTRNLDKPPFEVSETGWGEFEVAIRLTFVPESGEKAMTLWHHLKLHPWTTGGEPEVPAYETALAAGPVHSWQYEEIVFNDPYQPFLNTLLAHPPTPLPKTKRKPVPFNVANPESLEASMGGTPEFTQLLETDEARRLEEARKSVLAEQEKMRAIIIDKEQELEKLRK